MREFPGKMNVAQDRLHSPFDRPQTHREWIAPLFGGSAAVLIPDETTFRQSPPDLQQPSPSGLDHTLQTDLTYITESFFSASSALSAFQNPLALGATKAE